MSGRVTRLVHQALVYAGDAEFLAATVPFCHEGLAAREKVLAVTTSANLDLLARALGDSAGGVEFVESAGWYDAPGRALAACDRYVEAYEPAHPRVRVVGEPVWHGRTPSEEAEWTRYESAINAAFADRPLLILCAYDERALPGRIVADARRTHPCLLTGHDTQPSADYVEPGAFTGARDHLPLPPPPPEAAEIDFDGDLHRMRQRVRTAAAPLGLSRDGVDRLLLTVNEVAANAVEHGGGHGRITIWAGETTVVCDVTDPGKLETSLPGYLPPGPAARRGHGLWVVRQLCELLEVRSDDTSGTHFRLHLTRA